jgi:hypothetical protein
MRGWREWFVTPEDEEAPGQTEDAIRTVSGSGHKGEDAPLHLRKKLPPRCARCKKFMGFDTGMHIMLTRDWRVHIRCFNEVVEEHLEKGEAIDWTTGGVIQYDRDRPEDN